MAANCTNESLREQQGSTALPDCRAYEKVSPDDKSAGDVNVENGSQAAVSGQRVAYASYAAFPGSPANILANRYLAERGASGWSTANIDPPTLASPAGSA